nr:AarF/UbiB family protein [Tsukamurella sp. PLM1]
MYKGVLDDGRTVAVKVQYPRIETMVRADLKNMRLLMKALGKYVPAANAEALSAEIARQVTAELDFAAELDHHRYFADLFAGHPAIAVPEPVDELCTDRVLVTEFLEGEPFAAALHQDAAARNRLGEAIYRFYCGEMYRTGRFCADPHPGNVIVLPDGRAGFVDFGMTVRLAPADHAFERELFTALLRGEHDRVHALAVQAGFIGRPDLMSAGDLEEYIDRVVGWHLHHGEIAITPDTARNAVITATMPAGGFYDHFEGQMLQETHALGRRTDISTVALLGELRATADWRAVACEVLGLAPPATPMGIEIAEWASRGARARIDCATMPESHPEVLADARPRRGRPPSVGLAERRRQELTRAAFEVFAEQGYEQASVSDIANRAGIGQGTLYRYVEGKRELLDLVFDECVDQLLAAISPDEIVAVTATGDLAASERMVFDLGERLFALADERPDILKVLMVQSGTVDEELRYRIQGLYQTFDSMMGRALAHARERDWIVTRTGDPERETVLLGRLLPALGVPGLVMALNRDDDVERRAAYVRGAVRMSGRGILSDGARSAPGAESGPADPGIAAALRRGPAAVTGPSRAAQLLDAAVTEFVDNGYAEVGVREITARAGVSHGTFYNYFDSKRHLLAVLVDRNRNTVLGVLEDAARALDGPVTPAVLRGAVFGVNLSVLQYITERLDEFRFLMLEVPGVDAEAFAEYLDLYAEVKDRMAAILAPAVAAGVIDPRLAPGAIAEGWLGYMLGVVAAMVNEVDVTSPAESAHVVTSLLLGGARRQGG